MLSGGATGKEKRANQKREGENERERESEREREREGSLEAVVEEREQQKNPLSSLSLSPFISHVSILSSSASLSRITLLLDCATSPPAINSSRIKYTRWKLNTRSSSQTLPK